VLIVDDDPTVLEALSQALKEEFQVVLASNARTAEISLSQNPVDLIILDAVLRRESGLDFLSPLRKKSDVPVLVITGYGNKDMVAAAMRSRANDYLDKPFTLNQLREKARELTAAGHRCDHVAERNSSDSSTCGVEP
jgi:DNA-binding NtrC family response regulator